MTLSPGRAAAVRRLQIIRDRHVAHSFSWEVADHAIDLALSERRPDGPYLVADTLRNSRSIVAARNRRTRARETAFLGSDGLELAPALQRDPTFLASLEPDPERTLVWKDAYRRLASFADARRYGCQALDAWGRGEEVRDTASQIGVSDRQLKKERATIRTAAVGMLERDDGNNHRRQAPGVPLVTERDAVTIGRRSRPRSPAIDHRVR